MRRSQDAPADLLRRIAWAETVEEVWALIVDAMDGYGFDRLLYAATRFRGAKLVGEARDALILSNYPKDYLDAYVGGGRFKDAPLVRWAAANAGARSWTEVLADAEAGRLTDAEMEVVAFNRTHGARAGYAIAFPRFSERDAYGIGLAATALTQDEVDAVWAKSGDEITLVATVFHLKVISLPHGDYVDALTKRQRQVLQLVADGKTVADVALLIERNPATVEKHLRLARAALGVETTAQAILKVGLHNGFFTIADMET